MSSVLTGCIGVGSVDANGALGQELGGGQRVVTTGATSVTLRGADMQALVRPLRALDIGLTLSGLGAAAPDAGASTVSITPALNMSEWAAIAPGLQAQQFSVLPLPVTFSRAFAYPTNATDPFAPLRPCNYGAPCGYAAPGNPLALPSTSIPTPTLFTGATVVLRGVTSIVSSIERLFAPPDSNVGNASINVRLCTDRDWPAGDRPTTNEPPPVDCGPIGWVETRTSATAPSRPAFRVPFLVSISNLAAGVRIDCPSPIPPPAPGESQAIATCRQIQTATITVPNVDAWSSDGSLIAVARTRNVSLLALRDGATPGTPYVARSTVASLELVGRDLVLGVDRSLELVRRTAVGLARTSAIETCGKVRRIRALGRELFVDTTLGIERFYIDDGQMLRRGMFSLEETVSSASLRRRLSRLESVPSVRVCQVLAAALERTPLGRALLEREMELTTDGTLWVVWRNLVVGSALTPAGLVSSTDVVQLASPRVRSSVIDDRLVIEGIETTERRALRWDAQRASGAGIDRTATHELRTWITTESQRAGAWVVRRSGTTLEASRVVR